MSDARVAYHACPLCEGIETVEHRLANCAHHPLYRPGLPALMRWLRCNRGGHVYTDGYWSAGALALIFANANPHQLPGNDPHGSRAIAARMVEKLLRHAEGEPGAWLDIGFGNGALLGTAEEYGYRVVGLGLRQQAVALMRLDGIEAHVREFEAYRPAAPLDVISMADVLEHMPYPIPALQHAQQLLKPGGLLFLSMPNADCYAWRMLDRLGANPYWGELEHYHNFGRASLYRLLRQNGFEPLSYGISERYYLCMEVIARRS